MHTGKIYAVTVLRSPSEDRRPARPARPGPGPTPQVPVTVQRCILDGISNSAHGVALPGIGLALAEGERNGEGRAMGRIQRHRRRVKQQNTAQDSSKKDERYTWAFQHIQSPTTATALKLLKTFDQSSTTQSPQPSFVRIARTPSKNVV